MTAPTPYERLLAEQLPTGTFGDAQPPEPGPPPWTALQQAEHRATLDEALSGWHWDDDPRHLRLIPAPKTDAA